MMRICALLVVAVLFVHPARAGNTEDVYHSACKAYSQGHYSIAFRDLLPFAARGDAWSQFAIAEMLRTGSGVARNQEEALVWYRRAAEQGYGPAQCNLGTALYNGWGTATDPQAAIGWWIRGALNRNPRSMFNLGTELARGSYIVRDYVRAYRWLTEAFNLGYLPAEKVRETLRQAMTPFQIRVAEKMSLYDALKFERRELPAPANPPAP